MYYVVLLELLETLLGSRMNTLEVFTKLHTGVTNIVSKHPLGIKRRVTISIMVQCKHLCGVSRTLL